MNFHEYQLAAIRTAFAILVAAGAGENVFDVFRRNHVHEFLGKLQWLNLRHRNFCEARGQHGRRG